MSVISVLHAPRDQVLGRKIADALSRYGHAPRRISGDPCTGDLALADNAAIVIWSTAALKLARLNEQARDAFRRGALIPVAVGGASAPSGFDALAPVDLSGWSGDDNDPRWRFVLEEINIAAQRQQLADANVWAEPEAGVADEPVAEDQLLDDALFDEVGLDIPALDHDAEIIEAREDFMPPPARPAAASAHRKFNPLAVAIAGGLAIGAVAGAAILLAPGFLTSTDGAQINVAEGATPAEPGALAFVQPSDGFNSANNEAATPGDSQTMGANANPAAAFNLDAEEMRLTPPVLRDADGLASAAPEAVSEDAQVLELAFALGFDEEGAEIPTTDEITLSEEVSAEDAALEAAAQEEAAKIKLFAAIARGKQELASNGVVAPALPEETAPALAAPEQALSDAIGPDETAPDAAPVNEPAAIATLPVQTAPPAAGNVFKECADCPEMTRLEPGEFRMGAPASEPARHISEGPVTPVTVSKPFAIATTEVTFAQWDACIADGGCRYLPPDQGWGRADRPAVNVSFDDAKAYATWLSQKTGKTYRLPSEAEWEYAARAGSRGPFAIGATGASASLAPTTANYNAHFGYGGKKGEYRKQTVPVASFAPNKFGLFDMHGNAWEWTADCWAESHEGAPQDGSAALGGDCSRRVLKGGAWNTGGWRLRSAHRIGKPHTAREYDNGFRVVRDLD
ncbi:MAG: SUMF1/EgtB/PvdO family nonheme iron enzyme [Alphaproteobacteria bacterium]|nr:SUMF1/EgtB/PvdO family nonheme iron enzyme [Alphaproteobacteria bacterium]